MKATITVEKQSAQEVHAVAKQLGKTSVELKGVTPGQVALLLRKAGSKIASVHFVKKDQSLRKMCYRLGVQNPSHASKPKGTNSQKRQKTNKKNNLITVFDVNKVNRDKSGKVKYENGKQVRGAWRTVPLDRVTRICVDGVTYTINN